MSDTYCPLPWISINYIPNNITPCIFWKGSSTDIETLKKDMLAGKQISGCEQCYAAEQHGAESGRQEAIRMFGRPTEAKLKLLGISFDNLCNLKCRGCSTPSSHMWNDDEIAIYGSTFFNSTKYLETEFDADFSELTHLKISGGEPFLSKKADKFFTKLIEQDVLKNIDIGISSNGTVIPSPVVISAIQQAKKCTLSISFDGIGPLNDYFRSGSNFDTCIDNLNYFISLGIELRVHTTVSIYNINVLKEIEDYFKLNFPTVVRSHRVLLWPEQLSIQNMPDSLKDLLRPIVESYGPEYSDVLEAFNSTGKDLYGHFLNFHNTLDKLRTEILPNHLLADYIATNQISIDSSIFFKKQMDSLK